MIEEGQIIEELKEESKEKQILCCETELCEYIPNYNKRQRCATPKYCKFCNMTNHSFYNCSTICTNYKCSKYSFHKKNKCDEIDTKYYLTVA